MPRIINVKPVADYTLILYFNNGEEKVFDVKPYLNHGIFSQLKDATVFNSVQPFLGSVKWINDIDICPDTLYIESKPINNVSIAAESNPKYGV